MRVQIQNFIQRIIDIGITPNTAWREANRIQVTNALLVIAVPLVTINFVANFIQGDRMGLTIGFVWLAIAGVIPIMNHQKKHYFNYIYIISVFILMTDAVHIALGIKAYLSSLYIVSLIMIIFFFDKRKEYIIAFIYLAINYIATHYYLVNYGPIRTNPLQFEIHLYFIMSAITIVAITLRVLNESKRQLAEKERLLEVVETKNQQFERFAYITSHDLNEPIRSIMGFTQLLSRKVGKEAGSVEQEYMKHIQSSTLQLNRLLGSIMDFVEMSNASNTQTGNVDINTVLEKVKLKLSQKKENRQVQFKYKTLPTLKGVESQLIILFHNILDNAIKFNDNQLPIIEIKYKATEMHHQFSITDNGIGIDEKYFEKIFQPFIKLHNKAIYEGAGIGLAICKQIVEYHKGEISVNAELNKGTTIRFSIAKS